MDKRDHQTDILHHTGIKAGLILLGILLLAAGPAAASPAAVFNSSIPGERNIGQEFTFSIDNVSMRADVVYHYTVYSSRALGDHITYWSKAWGTWFTDQAPAGYQYLAVYVRAWTEGTTVWGYGSDRFYVWYIDQSIGALPVKLEDLPIRYKSEKYRPAVIQELENRYEPGIGLLPSEPYGWKDGQELTRMEPGLSNAWDGPILYLIPDSAGLRDLRVAGWFGDYRGTAVWWITEHEIRQASFESWLSEQTRILEQQRKENLRVSDREPDRGRA